jgi:ubiquinone/menaquinone biosynthesis C-methylase UbiE
MRLLYRIGGALRRWVNRDIYRKLYESHAAVTPGPEAVGIGDFDLIGRTELDLLRAEGLRPGDTLLDLGCGSGRLAAHAVPYLCAGAYVGVDISTRLLARARRRMALAPGQCRTTWHVPVGACGLAQPAQSVDMICAFSVFTHIEHEDAYRYLVEARRVVRPTGKMVFSCLPLELELAKEILREQAAQDFDRRWSHIRHVVTSRDLMSALATLAGWQVVRWYAGDEHNIPADGGQRFALGQSCCVLSVPGAALDPVA